jgi:hypothetical protein
MEYTGGMQMPLPSTALNLHGFRCQRRAPLKSIRGSVGVRLARLQLGVDGLQTLAPTTQGLGWLVDTLMC